MQIQLTPKFTRNAYTEKTNYSRVLAGINKFSTKLAKKQNLPFKIKK